MQGHLDNKYETGVKFGGELRLRYHNEESLGFSSDGVTAAGGPAGIGFQGTNEDFLLTRLRLWGDWTVNESIRVYVEGIYSDSLAEDSFQFRAIDRNFGDVQNVFVDTQLTDNLTFRVGRFEHQYGAQRLLSPLDWANTRQRFEGVKFLYNQDDWTIDAWWSVFVPVVTNEADEGDYNRRLYGAYATNKSYDNAAYDFYYIGFDDTRAVAGGDFSLHTVGARMWGSEGSWLYEAEGGYQFGRQSGLGVDHRASFFTVGLGKKLKIKEEWNPILWFYYDYASGDDESSNTFNNFNQLFPLAHKYLGFSDFAARSNISSPNVLLTTAPTDKWKFLAWYYYLASAEQSAAVPGIATNTVTLQNDVSNDFVHTLDLLAQYNFNEKSDIIFGYSTVWAGDKLEGGVDAVLDSDANFFYTQWTLRF